jgi:redox-sensitive bicupin YhaK (pirin superfamily)
VEAGSEVHKIEAHPHRGFEPVTFVFDGSVLHRDSLGNTGVIGAGEVQWITSGSGIIHEEGPTPELARDGGDLELIQLWINLPAAKKIMQPVYQELHAGVLPRWSGLYGRVELTVVAGTLPSGEHGPAVTQSPLFAAMGWMRAGGSGTLPLPAFDTVLLYVLGGSVRIADHVVDAKRLVVFNGRDAEANEPDAVSIEVLEPGRLLLLGGQPLNEPIATYGPFVMNTEDEIRTAFRDFAGGKFGSI